MNAIASNPWLMKSPLTVTVTGRDSLICVAGDTSCRFPIERPDSCSRLLQLLAGPLARGEFEEHLADIPASDQTAFNQMTDAGMILQGEDRTELARQRDRVFTENRGLHMRPQDPVCEHLIVACTGSIVAGLMAQTILSLSHSRFQSQLDVFLSRAAQTFMPPDLLEHYGIRCWTDMFERKDGIHVPHVHLARSADCILVLPATADSLNRLAGGACSDLLSTTVVASKAPVVVSPVMNDVMWNNAAVQRNVQTLREDGRFVIEPTVIFGAADMQTGAAPMFGGHGTLWAGPGALMRLLTLILSE